MSPKRFTVKNETDQIAAKFLHQLLEENPDYRPLLDIPVQVVGRPKDPKHHHVARCARCGHR